MEHVTLSIDGMSCGHCVDAVRRALEQLPGVQVEEVRIGSARVAYDDGQTQLSQLIDAVADEGYMAAVE